MTGKLVVNADDLGLSRGSSLGVLMGHREGIVSSASLVANGPDYRHAVDTVVRSCPQLGIGLHFNLTSGKPVSSPETVPTLIDDDGFFRWRFTSLLRALSSRRTELLQQIELELEAQLDRIASDRIEVDHLDSERHVHLIPQLFQVVVAAARRRGVPYVRMGSDLGWRFIRPRDLGLLTRSGGFAKSLLLASLQARNRKRAEDVHSCDFMASYLYSGRLDLLIPGLLDRLPAASVTELMVHPGMIEHSGDVTLGNRALERYLVDPARQRELQACIDARRDCGDSVLTNFRALSAAQPS